MTEKGKSIQPSKRRSLDKSNRGLLFILPYFIIFLCFTLYPILYTFKLSFHSWDGLGTPVFTGLANYRRLLNDAVFFKSIFNTVFIALLAMAPQMIFGLILAFLLNQHRFRGGNLFQTHFYFPKLLMALHIIAEPVNWKMNGLFTQLIVAFVLFWQYFGYYTIIFTAGIKGIPYDIMEAAEVDGANKFQTFFHIVLPQLRNIMTYAFVTSIIGGLQLFDLPFTFAGATGGPSKSVLTMVMYMYNIAFQNYDYGYGSAISYGLFVIIIVFSLIFMKYTAGKERNF